MELYADGSFILNPRRGGWGWVTDAGSWGQGYQDDEGRSHRMELMAVVEGLEHLPDGTAVTVYTDCLYVFLGAKRKRDSSPLWQRFLHHQRRLLLRVVKIDNHPLHTKAHHLAREAVFNGIARAEQWSDGSGQRRGPDLLPPIQLAS